MIKCKKNKTVIKGSITSTVEDTVNVLRASKGFLAKKFDDEDFADALLLQCMKTVIVRGEDAFAENKKELTRMIYDKAAEHLKKEAFG